MGRGSGIAMNCGVGRRCGWDPTLLWPWLWCRPAAVAPFQPLAWELPHAVGAALKSRGKKRKKEKETLQSRTLTMKAKCFDRGPWENITVPLCSLVPVFRDILSSQLPIEVEG